VAEGEAAAEAADASRPTALHPPQAHAWSGGQEGCVVCTVSVNAGRPPLGPAKLVLQACILNNKACILYNKLEKSGQTKKDLMASVYSKMAFCPNSADMKGMHFVSTLRDSSTAMRALTGMRVFMSSWLDCLAEIFTGSYFLGLPSWWRRAQNRASHVQMHVPSSTGGGHDGAVHGAARSRRAHCEVDQSLHHRVQQGVQQKYLQYQALHELLTTSCCKSCSWRTWPARFRARAWLHLLSSSACCRG
jgi:hypothetical protein